MFASKRPIAIHVNHKVSVPKPVVGEQRQKTRRQESPGFPFGLPLKQLNNCSKHAQKNQTPANVHGRTSYGDPSARAAKRSVPRPQKEVRHSQTAHNSNSYRPKQQKQLAQSKKCKKATNVTNRPKPIRNVDRQRQAATPLVVRPSPASQGLRIARHSFGLTRPRLQHGSGLAGCGAKVPGLQKGLPQRGRK